MPFKLNAGAGSAFDDGVCLHSKGGGSVCHGVISNAWSKRGEDRFRRPRMGWWCREEKKYLHVMPVSVMDTISMDVVLAGDVAP